MSCATEPTCWSTPSCGGISSKQIGLPRLTDVLDYHSSVPEAAETAARGDVGTLVLTHLVPAPAPGTEQEWIDQAAAHFGGAVILAHDLLSLEVTGAEGSGTGRSDA